MLSLLPCHFSVPCWLCLFMILQGNIKKSAAAQQQQQQHLGTLSVACGFWLIRLKVFFPLEFVFSAFTCEQLHHSLLYQHVFCCHGRGQGFFLFPPQRPFSGWLFKQPSPQSIPLQFIWFFLGGVRGGGVKCDFRWNLNLISGIQTGFIDWIQLKCWHQISCVTIWKNKGVITIPAAVQLKHAAWGRSSYCFYVLKVLIMCTCWLSAL